MPAFDSCTVVPNRSADDAASASTTSTQSGRTVWTIPATTSALSIPVLPSTPVVTVDTSVSGPSARRSSPAM